jgi:hypothetical protein
MLVPVPIRRLVRRRLAQWLGFEEQGFHPRFFQPMEPTDCSEGLMQ